MKNHSQQVQRDLLDRVLGNLRIASATLRNKAAEDSLTEEVGRLVGDVEPFVTAAFVDLFEARYPARRAHPSG